MCPRSRSIWGCAVNTRCVAARTTLIAVVVDVSPDADAVKV